MQDVIVHTLNPGGSTPATQSGPRQIAAGGRGPTAIFDAFLEIEGVPGESKNDRATHGPTPALQLPAPLVPQRSSFVDGTSNTLMIGEKTVRPAPVPAAPAGRR